MENVNVQTGGERNAEYKKRLEGRISKNAVGGKEKKKGEKDQAARSVNELGKKNR